MDSFEQIVHYTSQLPVVSEWPQMGAILERAAARKPRDWHMPVLACEAVGGEQAQAIPAGAAVACLKISIILIDDLLDADPRGEYHRIGMPATANLAAAFQAAAFEALAHSPTQPDPRLAAIECLNHMVLKTALGQQLDVENPTDEPAYWRMVQTKSSPFFGAALQAGALLGLASPETARQIRQVGQLYGQMIQIHDDLGDALATPASPDWSLGRASLPILFAELVDHPERERFIALRPHHQDPQALQEAQQILIRSGAVSYGVDQLMRRYQAARQALASIELAQPVILEHWLEDVIRPVSQLFAGLGLPGVPVPGATRR